MKTDEKVANWAEKSEDVKEHPRQEILDHFFFFFSERHNIEGLLFPLFQKKKKKKKKRKRKRKEKKCKIKKKKKKKV